ncbi:MULTISPECIES: MHYT domain-containing protein [Nocardiopsidaceae]|uniref:Histidine kinase n=2 Tax=Nocardiopsidaceae TaxID=83676 RepID=A0ABY6YPW4_9ACTN|nr:MHYT domain-containing protein [Streptomonospora nanhaiensis]MEE2044047.1 MHYT domain-containing protein [Nocardiopsis tropica]WAE74268.1 histidine kinase [Streptomonospora nanhaiensis]
MVEHFTHGALTPAVAYAVSVIGSFVGLMFAARARNARGAGRATWLVFSALCLGGTAVWSMHFIAMLGFHVPGLAIRYDATLTVASGLLAVLAMGLAQYLTVIRRGTGWLLAGGAIAGSGIVAMHYLGMASINMHGHLGHDPLFVGLAGAVALLAATAALWFTQRLRGVVSILLASLVMGIAVTSMHYTGMFGVHVTVDDARNPGAVPGSTAPELLLPLVVGLFVFLLVCSLLLMLGVDDSEPRRGARTARHDGEPAPVPALPGGERGRYTARHSTGSAWDRPA